MFLHSPLSIDHHKVLDIDDQGKKHVTSLTALINHSASAYCIHSGGKNMFLTRDTWTKFLHLFLAG